MDQTTNICFAGVEA